MTDKRYRSNMDRVDKYNLLRTQVLKLNYPYVSDLSKKYIQLE